MAAGAGCVVAKHGNRSATGKSGSADVLEALGARIDLEPGAVAECIETVGFGFMFAPHHHQAMRHVIPVRKELAVRTIFNFLGPLTNPAGATRQLIGVSDGNYLELIAAALGELGGERGLVVSSSDGLDEISVSGPTHVVELSGAQQVGATNPLEPAVRRHRGELQFRSGFPGVAAQANRANLPLADEPVGELLGELTGSCRTASQ